MQRAHLLAVAKAIAGTQVLKTNRSRFGKLRAVVRRSLHGVFAHRSYEIPELFFVLFAKGHQVDPVQAASIQRFLWLRKLLVQRPQWAPRLRTIWMQYQCREDLAPGLVGSLFEDVFNLGMVWIDFSTFGLPDGGELPILDSATSHFLHVIRDLVRRRELVAAELRRGDCNGLRHLDRSLLKLAVQQVAHSSADHGLLEAAHTGAICTQVVKHRILLADSPVCPFCGEGNESLEHRWLVCPRWSGTRMPTDL